MKLIPKRLDYGKPWNYPDVYIFTGNPIRRNDGAIVMGRGAAKQVRDCWPAVQFNLPVTNTSLLVFYNITPTQLIGWFKVKNHWREPANVKLIYQSAHILKETALEEPEMKFHMNAPGIGNGRLVWQDIVGIIEELPDNVYIYKE